VGVVVVGVAVVVVVPQQVFYVSPDLRSYVSRGPSLLDIIPS
jgi:hypothetical protein